MRTLIIGPLLMTGLLSGCQDKPNIAEEQSEIDSDGDGFPQGEDCDDSNSDVNPDMEEQCDSIDNDCDGIIDEDVETIFYIDSDEDGFGTEGFLFEACEPPDGYVPVGNDCNDSDPLSYPGAIEVCDGLDNDCDTEVDEDVLLTFYQDADADSFGNPDVSILECTAPEGYVDNDEDCDDTNPDIYPGAAELSDPEACMSDADGDGYGDSDPPDGVTPGDDCDDDNPDVHPDAIEICDGIDNDCDGLVDDDDPDIDYSYGVSTLYPDNDGDGFGDPNADLNDLITACAPVDGYVNDNTDCDDTPITGAVIYPGAPETCDFVDNDCDNVIDAPQTVAFFETGALVATDMTAEFTGGPALPATPLISDDGMLSVCEGNYYINMSIEGNVDIEPIGTVVFDGSDQGSIIMIDTPGITVNLHDLQIQHGYGSLNTSLNTPNNGGGIACRGAGTSIHIDTVNFESNFGDLGGGLFLDQCDASLNNVTFSDNQAEWGGGMYAESADVTGSVISFAENESVTAGGGAYWGSGGTYDLNSVSWTSNNSGYGGGLYGWQVDINITDGVWSSNAADSGGAMLYYEGIFNLNGGTFNANESNVFGGAIRLGGDEASHNTNTSFTSTEWTENTALYGGAMAIAEGSHTFTDSLFELNTASFGGALLIGEQDINTQANLELDVMLDGTLIRSNLAALGGATYLRFGAELNCDGSTAAAGFESNAAPPQGGTGAVHILTNAVLNAQQCTFGAGNQDNAPADIYLEQGSTQVTENYGTAASITCTNLTCSN